MKKAKFKKSIVVFLGPVGVGKSTQIRLLHNYLETKNCRSVSTYIKSSHIFANLLSQSLRRMGLSENVVYPDGVVESYPKKSIVRKIFPLWVFLDSISLTLKFFFSVIVPFSLGYTVLIEEGPFMTFHTYLVSFPTFFNTKPVVLPFSSYLLGWLLSKSYFQIVLEGSDQDLEVRRKKRRFRRSELAKYVLSQKMWMQNLTWNNAYFVDTSRADICSVHKNIVKILEKEEI